MLPSSVPGTDPDLVWIVSSLSPSGPQIPQADFWRVQLGPMQAVWPEATQAMADSLAIDLFWKAQRAGLDDAGVLTLATLIERLRADGRSLTLEGGPIQNFASMMAPRPLPSSRTNPLLVLGTQRRKLLASEIDADTAAAIGMRCAWHRTLVLQCETGWAEVDVAGPSLDRFSYDGTGLPLCVAPIDAAKLTGWIQTLPDLLEDMGGEGAGAGEALQLAEECIEWVWQRRSELLG